MPTTYSGRSAVVGFGRQTAEGAPLASPKYEIPMGGGQIGPDRSVEELPWTFDSQDVVGHYVSRNAGTVDVTLPILPISCVPILQGVLGARATSGVGPYTHVLTPADSLPFLTFFYQQPGANFWTLADTKIGSWQLSWSPGSPLKMSVSGMGKTLTRAGTKWAAATLAEGVDPFFSFLNATLKLDVGATPATTVVHNIAGGSISVNRNLEAIQTDEIGYRYMAEQNRSFEVTLDDVVFESNDFLNTVHTGSTTGTTLSGSPTYGSLDFTFRGSDQAAVATRSLNISIPRVLFSIDSIPGADPSGGVVRYTVTGAVSKPATGATITATVINGDAGTNY